MKRNTTFDTILLNVINRKPISNLGEIIDYARGKILYTMQCAKVHRKYGRYVISVAFAPPRNIEMFDNRSWLIFDSDRTYSFVSHSHRSSTPFSHLLSLSPFFLFVRSISFSPSSFLLLPPSDRKQIRDTAAAQQQVVRFACRVFRVTRGNRHGNLIFTEKLIIPAVSCIYTIVDRVSSKAYHRRLGTGGIIAWPPIREREREREEEETRVVSGNFAAIVIGD